jgi:DNA-binding transcriptional ArsR family regulator
MKTIPDTVILLERCEVECEAVSQELAETFRVLADAGRVRLILALLEGGELCVCDLAAVTGLSQTACSHNLRLLRAGRIVRYRRSGRNVFYTLDDAHIRLLLDVGLQHLGHEGTGKRND